MCERPRLLDEVDVKGPVPDNCQSPTTFTCALLIAFRGRCKKIQCKRVFVDREARKMPGGLALALLALRCTNTMINGCMVSRKSVFCLELSVALNVDPSSLCALGLKPSGLNL